MKLNKLDIKIFGASHEKSVGLELSGIPKGEQINLDELQLFIDRRKPSDSVFSTKRKESDKINILSGITENRTDGSVIGAEILNIDSKSADYAENMYIPRPSHADYASYIKYGRIFPGGGRFSGRMTAPLVIAGGIIKQILARRGIVIISYISEIGKIKGLTYRKKLISPSYSTTNFPAPLAAKKMLDEIKAAAESGDSIGGVIETIIYGLQAGLGGELFDGLEGKISSLVFGIPAVKGIQFGGGFLLSNMRGSTANDPFALKDDKIITASNHSGGISGGVSNGMPITFRVAIKPTPSISLPQKSVDLRTMKEAELIIKGRHDACIAPRAVPCIESAAAIAIYDEILNG